MLQKMLCCCSFLAVTLFLACGSPPQSETGTAEADLRGGCHAVCPKCLPNQPCIMMACFEVCKAKTGATSGPACGNGFCPAGQICCNDSCGVCTPPDGACTMQVCSSTPLETTTVSSCTTMAMCVEGYVWSDTLCACVPTTTL